MSDLIEQLRDRKLKDQWFLREEAADTIERLQKELADRGEFICKKCGLRKDHEHERGEF